MKVRETGVQLAVPSWMLDPVLCRQLVDEPRPRVVIAALLELADVLDSQPSLASSLKRGHQHDAR